VRGLGVDDGIMSSKSLGILPYPCSCFTPLPPPDPHTHLSLSHFQRWLLRSPISKSKKVATAKSAPVAKSPSSIFYAECEKGRLVQEVLCRWWYAIDWPDAASKESPGLEYDSLSGLPGVFVCTSGDKVGQILDKRNKSTCPNFQNMVQKSVGDLKSLLAKAISSQKAVLVKNGEKGTETDKILDETADWAKVINDGATEREATKVIAEHGLEL